jgi:hypothetical protein
MEGAAGVVSTLGAFGSNELMYKVHRGARCALFVVILAPSDPGTWVM